MMTKKYFLYFRVVVTLAILIVLFKFVPFKKLVEVYTQSNKIYLFLSFFIFFCCSLIAAGRWKYLLYSLGMKISLKEIFLSYYCSIFFNLFFPSFIAGDIFRGLSIFRRHGGVKKVAASILMSRFSGMIALIVVIMLFSGLGSDIVREKQVVFSLFILGVLALFSCLVIFSKSFFLRFMKILSEDSRLRKKIVAFYDQLYFFKKNFHIFIKSLFFSIPLHILSSFGFFIASKAFHVEINMIHFFILVPIITAVAFLPITIAGIGTREVAAVYLFSLIGIDESIGLGISLVNLVSFLFLGLLGGVIYVTVYHRWLQSPPK